MHFFDNPDVFEVAFCLWMGDVRGDDGDMGAASLPLGIMCSQMNRGVDNKRLLDAAVLVSEDMDRKRSEGRTTRSNRHSQTPRRAKPRGSKREGALLPSRNIVDPYERRRQV